jgi:RimJ/RimL family protein N-acetyltransferase
VGVRLETERLVIRSFEERDAEPWIAMVTDADFRRHLPPEPPPSREAFEAMIERRRAMERERGHAMWAVDTKDQRAFVGQCGLWLVEGTGPEVELAYHFTPASWNLGYATEAARAVLAYAFGPVGLERVIAFVAPENVASCRVAEKAGMRFEGHATAYDIEGLRKYVAERESMSTPGAVDGEPSGHAVARR